MIKFEKTTGQDGRTKIRPQFYEGENKKPRIRVGLTEKGIEIKTKDPEIVLKNAEKCFRNEDFENAFIKLGFVKDEDIEKRATELLESSSEEKELAEKMYLDDKWREKAKEEWSNSSVIEKKK